MPALLSAPMTTTTTILPVDVLHLSFYADPGHCAQSCTQCPRIDVVVRNAGSDHSFTTGFMTQV